MSKPAETWMPLYIGDYLADTMHLTHAQHGIYLLLIMAYWRTAAPLPDDAEQLAAIAKCSPAEWRKHQSVICKFFTAAGGVWLHKRIDTELAAAAKKTAERRKSGANGAAKRWQTNSKDDGSAIVLPIANAWQNDAQRASPSPSQSQKEGSTPPIIPPRSGGGRVGFDNWWLQYPHKVGKRAAETEYARALARAPPAEIAAGLQRYLVEKPDDRPWCNPSTWLKQDRWLDQPDETPRSNRSGRNQQLSPADALFLGAARAADAVERRDREAAARACCPDCPPAQSLLDRR